MLVRACNVASHIYSEEGSSLVVLLPRSYARPLYLKEAIKIFKRQKAA